MARRLIVIILGLLSASVPAVAQPGSVKGKKVIEWGWDEPDTKFMRENIEKMEQFPFDGLVFHATSGKGVDRGREAAQDHGAEMSLNELPGEGVLQPMRATLWSSHGGGYFADGSTLAPARWAR